VCGIEPQTPTVSMRRFPGVFKSCGPIQFPVVGSTLKTLGLFRGIAVRFWAGLLPFKRTGYSAPRLGPDCHEGRAYPAGCCVALVASYEAWRGLQIDAVAPAVLVAAGLPPVLTLVALLDTATP
jgi:hypothetical protein